MAKHRRRPSLRQTGSICKDLPGSDDKQDHSLRSIPHARHRSSSCPHRFPASKAPRDRNAAVESGLPLQSELRALPRKRGTEPDRRDDGRDRGRRHRFPRRQPRDHSHRPHRGRARAEPQFPPPGDRRSRARAARDRPLQPDHTGGARFRRPGGVPGSSRRRDRRLAALLPGRERRRSSAAKAYSKPASKGSARLNALGYGRADSGLVLNLVYNPQGASLPPAQAALEAYYKRYLGERYGIRVRPSVHARQHADPALRQHADLQRASSTPT